ncbi:MOSC domain-containing protein [Fusarium keratoplasticum]|nr:MOSC domain-containing protein [Fusarium keratoplasticum]
MSMRVEAIYTYPIKSLRGVSLSSINAKPTGFAYDRHFMLWDVNKKENLHIGLRPALCLFATRLTPEDGPRSIEVEYGLNHVFDQPSEHVDPSPLSVPLEPDVKKLPRVTVTMHFSPCSAYDMGSKYNDWFTHRLGYPVKLLYIGDHRRKVLGNMGEGVAYRTTKPVHISLAIIPVALTLGYSFYSKGKAGSTPSTNTGILILASFVVLVQQLRRWICTAGPSITFADLAAYLIISTKSHQDVNERLPDDEEMDITKFRANIVVSGANEAYEEDFWSQLRIGGNTTMKLTQNCARCSSLNVDYATGKAGKTEAGKVLKKLSKNRRVDPGTKWSPIFGRYGFLASASTKAEVVVISVGDEVEVTGRNLERTITEYPKS